MTFRKINTANFISQGGNSMDQPVIIGSNDPQPVFIRQEGINRMEVSTSGSLILLKDGPPATQSSENRSSYPLVFQTNIYSGGVDIDKVFQLKAQVEPTLSLVTSFDGTDIITIASDGMTGFNHPLPEAIIDIVGRVSTMAFRVQSSLPDVFIICKEDPSGNMQLGFFGSSGAYQPIITGSRGGNIALANLLSGLANLGLINDLTTV